MADFPEKFKNEYFSVAIDGEEKVPVLLTLADDWEEGRYWAERQLREMAQAAERGQVQLPFDLGKVQLFDRPGFLEQIGPEAAASKVFKMWYAFSRITYLRRRIEVVVEETRQLVLHGGGGDLPELVTLMHRLWLNLDYTLERAIHLPDRLIEVDHEPSARCFTCADLAGCEPGQRFTLANPLGQKSLWN